MGSETLPSACYILSDESSIPFYSTSNGYRKNAYRSGVRGMQIGRYSDKSKYKALIRYSDKSKYKALIFAFV